ncbi:MAG: MFS transporter [Lysobacteraceae bacterium]|nr:MAG: MFS transporter [Xanthomonadaceae bacterium]
MRGLNREAYLLLSTTLITNVGNGMHLLTVGKLLYDKTGSAAVFGFVIVMEYAASFVFQVIAGPWVDRGNPKWSCVGACLARGGVILLAALMLHQQQQIFWVVAASLVIQAVKPFYRSAQFALAPSIVPAQDLMRFNSYNGIAVQAGQLLGVAAVGPILTYGGAPLALGLNGGGFILAALLSMAIRVDIVREPLERAGAALGNWLTRAIQDWRDVFAVVRSNPIVFWLLLFAAGDYLLVGLVNLLLAPMVENRYGGNDNWLSLLDGSFAVGAMSAAFVVETVARRLGERNAVLLGLGGQAAGLAALAWSAQPYAGLALMAIVGAANTLSCVVLLSVLQKRAPARYRGRLSSIRNIYLAAFGAAVVPLVSHLEQESLAYALLASAVIGSLFWAIVFIVARPRRHGMALFDAADAQAQIRQAQ